MKLEINLLDMKYISTEKAIPIVVKISSDKETEIATKIDLKKILLIKDDEPVIGMYRICTLGITSNTFEISRIEPHYIVYDVYKDCTEIDITQGEYDVFVKLIVYEKQNDGDFVAIELEGKKPITIV